MEILAMENTKYELQDFYGGGKTTALICYRNKIVVPNKLQKAVISWYHTTPVTLEAAEQSEEVTNTLTSSFLYNFIWKTEH
jgi:hypothetical protein